jgi:hypothetical protein
MAAPPAVSPSRKWPCGASGYGVYFTQKRRFGIELQRFVVTCQFAGTPMQTKQAQLVDAGLYGAACWLISS